MKQLILLIVLGLASVAQAQEFVMDEDDCGELYVYSAKASPAILANDKLNLDRFSDEMVKLHTAKYGELSESMTPKVRSQRMALLYLRKGGIYNLPPILYKLTRKFRGLGDRQIIQMAADQMATECLNQ